MFKKLIRKFVEKHLYDAAEPILIENLRDWLYSSYRHTGFIQYYKLRKRNLMGLLENGIKDDEYWITIGKLRELKSMNTSMNIEVARRQKEEKKQIREDKKKV